MKLFFYVATIVIIFLSGVSIGLQLSERTKVGLYIEDWKTGCQYIQNPNGGITPRIDADGVHFGCKGLQASS